MKNFVTILIVSVLLLTLFTNCASSQFDKKPPFTIVEAKHQEWLGGKPGSKGKVVTIVFAEKVADNIKFDSIYFNKRAIPLNVAEIDGKTTLNSKFNNFDFINKNLIMDADPKKEFGNKPPKPTQELPFQLSDNECAISYTVDGKKHYFKLDKLQKGKAIIYP